jgi:hypothetical protein
MGGIFWLFIIGLFCYICILYYFYVDSLMPLAGLHFCVGLNFVTPSCCDFFSVNIIITITGFCKPTSIETLELAKQIRSLENKLPAPSLRRESMDMYR